MSLAEGHMKDVYQHFRRASSLKLRGQFELNFICSILANGGKKFIFFHPGHMTRMATMLMYGKNLKKSSSPGSLGRLL